MRQLRVHLPRHAVLDRDDVRQLRDPRAQLRAHQIAAVRMAPQRDADVHLLAERPVVFEQRIVPVVHEVQHRRVHHDEVGADRHGVPPELDHHVHVLVRARHDGAGPPAQRLHRDLEQPLALRHRHRKELALLAGDEHAVDAELAGPVPQVARGTRPRRATGRTGTGSAPPPRCPAASRGRRPSRPGGNREWRLSCAFVSVAALLAAQWHRACRAPMDYGY